MSEELVTLRSFPGMATLNSQMEFFSPVPNFWEWAEPFLIPFPESKKLFPLIPVGRAEIFLTIDGTSLLA